MINNHGNNGGGNPNHAEDGKFTSKENASTGKKEKTSEEKVLKQMGLGADELKKESVPEEPKPKEEKYKPKFDHYDKRTIFLNKYGVPQVEFKNVISGFKEYPQTFWEPGYIEEVRDDYTMDVVDIMESQLIDYMSDEEYERYKSMGKSNNPYDLNFLEEIFDKYLDKALDDSSERHKNEDYMDFITEDIMNKYSPY